MSHKSQVAYDAVLKYINEEIILLECRAYMTDYELALRNAFAKVALNAEDSACHFHFVQANKRYVQRLRELVDFLKSKGDDAKAGNELFNHLLNLPLLPADQIKEMFLQIKHKALALNHKGFKRYLNYFENQWIIKEGPEKISVFGRLHRTTSAVEAANRVLGQNLPTKGGFWPMVRSLRFQEQKWAYNLRLIAKSGGAEGPKKKLASRVSFSVIHKQFS